MVDESERRALARQALTATTFVEIVDTLVADFDVIEALTLLTSRSVELLEAAAAGILLADSSGQLRVIGASTEQVGLLELFQIQNDEGPCLDCTLPVNRSRSLTFTPSSRAGRSSWPPPPKPGSPPYTWCRCAPPALS